eukprot:30854-Pelagococcus_subviridis.AAC.8
MDAATSDAAAAADSNASARRPRAAAAREKNPIPAPTSTKTAFESCAASDPTSASALVGSRGSQTPACHRPRAVTAAPDSSVDRVDVDASEPSSGVKTSNGGSHAAETGYAAFGFTSGIA